MYKHFRLLFLLVFLFGCSDPNIKIEDTELLTWASTSYNYGKGTITKADLFTNIQGQKNGFTITSITVASGSDVADVSGGNLRIKKVGRFAVNLVLEKIGYNDVRLNGCVINITKETVTLIWNNTMHSKKSSITKADLFTNIQGQKNGFTIASITVASGSDVADVSGGNLRIKKVGQFAVNLVLEKSGYNDVRLNACEIKITPHKTKLTKIHLQKFPALRSDGSSWDSGVFLSDSQKRPDLIFKIYDSDDNIVTQLTSANRESDARQSDVNTFIWRVNGGGAEISSNATNKFKLYDYDTSSADDIMGVVNFSPHTSDFPSEYIAESSDGRVKIKLWFAYEFQ